MMAVSVANTPARAESPTHHLGRRAAALAGFSIVVLLGAIRLVATGRVSPAAVLIFGLLLLGVSPIIGAYVWLYSNAAAETHRQLRARTLPSGDRMGTLRAYSWEYRAMFGPLVFVLLVVLLQAVIPEVITKDFISALVFPVFAAWPVLLVAAFYHYRTAWRREVTSLPGAVVPSSWPRVLGEDPPGHADAVFRCGVVTPVGGSTWHPRYDLSLYSSGLQLTTRRRGSGPFDRWFVPWSDIQGAEDVSYQVPSRYGNACIPAVRLVLNHPRVPVVLWSIPYKAYDALKTHGLTLQ